MEKLKAVAGESGQVHVLSPSRFATTEFRAWRDMPRMAFLMFVFSHLRCQSEMLQSRKKIISQPHKN